MKLEEKNRVWARNAKGLRVMSGWVGVLTVVWAFWAYFSTLYAGVKVNQPKAVILGFIPAVAILVSGLFIMALGRVVASIAEIQCFLLNDSKE